jgi:hypothetical protein
MAIFLGIYPIFRHTHMGQLTSTERAPRAWRSMALGQTHRSMVQRGATVHSWGDDTTGVVHPRNKYRCNPADINGICLVLFSCMSCMWVNETDPNWDAHPSGTYWDHRMRHPQQMHRRRVRSAVTLKDQWVVYRLHICWVVFSISSALFSISLATFCKIWVYVVL